MLAFKIRRKPLTPNAIHLSITEFLNIAYHPKEHSFSENGCFQHQVTEWGSIY
jgi:hypothetical protein